MAPAAWFRTSNGWDRGREWIGFRPQGRLQTPNQAGQTVYRNAVPTIVIVLDMVLPARRLLRQWKDRDGPGTTL